MKSGRKYPLPAGGPVGEDGLPDGVVKKDPPPDGRLARMPRGSKYDPVRDWLDRHPGEWVRVGQFKGQLSAGSVRMSLVKRWGTEEYEVVSRNNEVYARRKDGAE